MRSMEELNTLVNQYYFEEFVRDLPPALQELAVDPLVLYHRELENPITVVTQQVKLEYWLSPWLLNDIFEADDEQVLIINKGFVPVFLGYLVLDHLVDRQTPDYPLIPLLTHQFYFAAAKQFSLLLSNQPSFWQAWFKLLKAHSDALSIEFQSVSQLNPPFSYERMQMVALGKAMPFQIAAQALGHLSQRPDLIELVSKTYFYHMFADQFYDDADDYVDDWQIRRATMAHVFLAEAENIPVSQVFDFELAELRDRVIHHRIREKMVDESSKLLNEAVALFPANLHTSRLYGLLLHRLEMNEVLLKSFKAVSFMRRLKNSLK